MLRPSPHPPRRRIELDPVCRNATRDGRHHLDLSVKQFAFLGPLLGASPAHPSTEDLLEQVSDAHADPFTNTVTVTRPPAPQARPTTRDHRHAQHRLAHHTTQPNS
jgi:hypothetical protein